MQHLPPANVVLWQDFISDNLPLPRPHTPLSLNRAWVKWKWLAHNVAVRLNTGPPLAGLKAYWRVIIICYIDTFRYICGPKPSELPI